MKVNIDLTRKQELHFISLGLKASLTNQIGGGGKRGGVPGRHWSEAQRKKFAASMSRVWQEKKEKPKKAKPNGHARPNSRWTPERRRQFALTMKKKGFKPKKTAGDLLREQTSEAIKRTIAKSPRLKVEHVGPPKGALRRDGKPLREPSKQWTEEHRKNFVAAMKKKREETKGKKVTSVPQPRHVAAAT